MRNRETISDRPPRLPDVSPNPGQIQKFSMAALGGAAAGHGGAGAGPPVAGKIDPDLLEEKSEDCECGMCLGVMSQIYRSVPLQS